MSGRGHSGAAKYRNVIGAMTLNELWPRIAEQCRANPDFRFGDVVDNIVQSMETYGMANPFDQFDPPAANDNSYGRRPGAWASEPGAEWGRM